MSQYNFGNLESPLSGTTFFNTHLEPWRDALHSTHSGNSRPAYAVGGMIWLDTTTTPWLLKMFNGTADDVTLGRVDATALTFDPMGKAEWGGSAGGTANALTLTPSPAMPAWATGLSAYDALITADNTAEAPTINISGKGAKTIKVAIGAGKVDAPKGALRSGMVARFVYDGTHVLLVNPAPYLKAADIATAATVNLNAATGDYVKLTGTTTVTAFTLNEGVQKTVLAGGAFIITDGSGNSPQGIINPGAANITTAAGDTFIIRGEAGGTTRIVAYTKANGQALVAAASGGHGQCYLDLNSGNARLMPFNGNKITINGVTCTIPDAGVTLAGTGLSATTNYYVYARDANGDGVVDALEASTTAPAVQAGSGVLIKTGDATRTYVGVGYVKTAATWFEFASWFNPRFKTKAVQLPSNRTTTSTSSVELNSADRVEFVMHTEYGASISIVGSLKQNSSGSFSAAVGVGLDGTSANPQNPIGYSYNNATSGPFHVRRQIAPGGVTTGYHYAGIWGYTISATYPCEVNSGSQAQVEYWG